MRELNLINGLEKKEFANFFKNGDNLLDIKI